jgi:glycogen(starch) synthase
MKNILMLGPGKPNPTNSGLGLAAFEISQFLKEHTLLTLLQPEEVNDGGGSDENTITLKEHSFSDFNVMTDLATLSIESSIAPYWYQQVTPEESGPNVEESTVYQELITYSDQVVSSAKPFNYDLIYAHDWISFQAAIQLKEKTKKPLILHMHSLDYDRSGKNSNSWVFSLEKEAFEKADAIICVSEYTKNIIEKEYGTAPSKIQVVHNGYTSRKYPAKKSPFKEKIVLFVGRLTRQKGASQFLKIAELVHEENPDTRFIMVGEGDLYASLIEAGAKSPVAAKFHLTNFLSGDDLLQTYAMADVYCMPSVSEPFGLTALEAAGAGLPMVVSQNTGVAEVLSSALIADHESPEAFAKQLLTLLKDDKLTKQLSDKGKELVSKLDWVTSNKKILAVLNQF